MTRSPPPAGVTSRTTPLASQRSVAQRSASLIRSMMTARRYGAVRAGPAVSFMGAIVRHGPAARNRKHSQIPDLPTVFSLRPGQLLWDNQQVETVVPPT